MTAREAMAYGRAVVTTGVGGLADAIEDGVTGLVVPPGDAVALRAALERLLADGDAPERLGAAARDRRARRTGGRRRRRRRWPSTGRRSGER